MRIWAAVFLGVCLSGGATAARLTLVLDSAPTTPIEVTDADALCIWTTSRVVSLKVSENVSKLRRDGKEGACVAVKADGYRVTTSGTEVALEWSTSGEVPKGATAPLAVPKAAAAAAAATPITPAAATPATPAAATPATPAAAEAAAAVESDAVLKNFKKYTVDVPIPESPAFTVMNVTPTDVVHPTSLRAWATSLLHTVDKDGKVKDGLAIDGAPYALLNQKLSLYEYIQMNAFEKVLMNTHVSMGTAKGSEADDKSLKLGLGLRVRLFDRGDPREDRELIDCYVQAAGGQSSASAFFTSEVKDGPFKKCWDKRKSARWNASSGVLAAGQAWTSQTGNLNDRERSSNGAWLSLAYGFEEVRGMQDNFQILGLYKALNSEVIADPLDKTKKVDRDSRIGAIQLRFGVEAFAGSFETSWQRFSIPGREQERTRRYAVGLEYRIAPNMWLVASTGSEKGGANDGKGFVMGTFRFGSATSSTFGPP